VTTIRAEGKLASGLSVVVDGLRVEVRREDGMSVLWQADSDVLELDGAEDCVGNVAV
jgi:hypothetical protein